MLYLFLFVFFYATNGYINEKQIIRCCSFLISCTEIFKHKACFDMHYPHVVQLKNYRGQFCVYSFETLLNSIYTMLE